jgi:hypothetical protein
VNLIPKFLLSLFQKKEETEKYTIVFHSAKLITKKQKEIIKHCKKILSDNNVPLNKIRFVIETPITYDLDRNRINPAYKQLIPKNRKLPIIEINKPHNIMTIYLGKNQTNDNFDLLKELVKTTKKGIVILADDTDLENIMWLVNLDDAINYYHSTEFFDITL